MKVSVITVCYNSEASINSALDSVQSQDYPNIEHIVKDGNSTDGTIELIRRHPSSLIRLISGKDYGIYDAINIGLQNSTGDVIGLMHSDDMYADDHVVSDIVKMFKSGCDVVYGDLRYVSKSDIERVVRKWKSGPYKAGSIRRGWMPPHPTVYMTRKVFESLGLYRTDYRIAADYDYMVRLFSLWNLNVGYLDRVTVDMRTGGASNRSISNIIQKTNEDFKVMMDNGFGFANTLFAIVYKNTSKLGQLF